VLCYEEKRLVDRSERPDAVLWGLWAAKETAYKVIFKSFPHASSSPLKYRVIFEPADFSNTYDKQAGVVETPHGRVSVKIFYHENHVHCIGINGDMTDVEKIMHGYGNTGLPVTPDISSSKHESAAVRKIALAHVARILQRNADDMEIKSSVHNGQTQPPALYLNGIKEAIDISLSHDERFVAYAFYNNKNSHSDELK
jgi:phosphopantetheinyl transferase (holo-ACP synthase)